MVWIVEFDTTVDTLRVRTLVNTGIRQSEKFSDSVELSFINPSSTE